jgi:hypothetical protein
MTLDWLLLIALIPLILVPLVLLFGLAGCGLFESAAKEVALEPSNFIAEGLSSNQIMLTWTDIEGGAATYTVDRAVAGGTSTMLKSGIASNSHPDSQNLTEGTTYIYLVRTVVAGKDDSKPLSATVTTWPATPTVVATPVDVDRIEVTWTNNSASPTKSILEYGLAGTGPFAEVPMNGQTSFSHTGLTPGKEYDYKVSVTMKGFNKSQITDIRSNRGSDTARTLQWKEAYFEGLLSGALGVNGAALDGDCLVQRIDAGHLKASGSKVRIRLRGATNGNLVINKVFISQAAKPGTPGNLTPDAWDSHSDLMDLKPGVASLSLPQNGEVTLGPVPYALDKTQDLVIAFDITTGPARRLPVPALPGQQGPSAHIRGGATEAATTDRVSTGYSPRPNAVCIVERIEVLSA